MPAMGIDLLAFTGTRVCRATGTGGLVIGDQVDPALLTPLVRGGTGSRSESEEQPEILPDKYESGTCNGVGLAVWRPACAGYGRDRGGRPRTRAGARLGAGRRLRDMDGVTVYGPPDPAACVAVVSCRVAGRRVSEVGLH